MLHVISSTLGFQIAYYSTFSILTNANNNDEYVSEIVFIYKLRTK